MSPGNDDISIETRDLDLAYGRNLALDGVSLVIPKRQITSLIGPSGCGKTTLLRCFNRMNDEVDGVRIRGKVWVEGIDIYHSDVSVEDLRKKLGMVFQKSNPFPMSIRDNVTFGPRMARTRGRDEMPEVVERSLKLAGLWDEVKDRLQEPALDLSGGQQQRLCIARALANEPDILLLDEPASALDPISTSKIEETLLQLKERFTIVIVTHNLQQAARIADHTAFIMQGRLVELAPTTKLFTVPRQKLTEEYLTGRFG
jgi:phosphate transport system ATP-binding protein